MEEVSAEKVENSQETFAEDPKPEHQADVDTQKSTVIPQEKVLSEIDPKKADDGAPQTDEDKKTQADVDTQKSTVVPEEKVLSEIDPEKSDDGEPHDEHEEDLEPTANLTLPEVLKEMENIMNGIQNKEDIKIK